MVTRLARLKLRLLWNGLRADWQRRIGFPATIAGLAIGSWYLSDRYRDAVGAMSHEGLLAASLWAALGLYVVWVALPVVIFPLDENLDPARFSLAPLSPAQLTVGLGVSAMVAPSIVIPLVTLGTNVVVFAEVLPGALIGAVLFIAVLVVSGQLFTTAISAVLRTRRGRDLAMFIVAGLGLGVFGAQAVVRGAVRESGLEGAALANTLEGWWSMLPPVAAQRVVTESASGRPLGGLFFALVTTGWIVALAWVWQKLLNWMLTTPEQSPGPSRRSRGRGLAASRFWSVPTVLAKKELRFYVRDPRQRLVWTGAVIFVGLAVASILVGTTGLGLFRSRSWLPLLAPALVLFVGLPIALNLFGWERNAASFLFVMPAKPRHLIMGKNLAITVGLILETVLLSAFLAYLSDSWGALRFVPALTVCAIGCQLAVGNFISVVTPLRLPREGTDVFAQATEQGCLAIVAQVAAFFVIGLMLVLPSSVMVLTVDFGQVIPAWFANLFALVWGAIAYLVSLWISGWLLRRRVPEVVGWVQVV